MSKLKGFIDILPNSECYRIDDRFYRISSGHIVSGDEVLDPYFIVNNPINGIMLCYKYYGENSLGHRRRDSKSCTFKFKQIYFYIKTKFKDENKLLYDITADKNGDLIVEYIDIRLLINQNNQFYSKDKQEILINNYNRKDSELKFIKEEHKILKEKVANLEGKIYLLEASITGYKIKYE